VDLETISCACITVTMAFSAPAAVGRFWPYPGVAVQRQKTVIEAVQSSQGLNNQGLIRQVRSPHVMPGLEQMARS
jgi:hypothetical protein